MRAKAYVKDVGGQCIVETRNDWAEDVRACLETAGLHVNAGIPIDIRSNVHQFVVTMPDGATITAQNVRVLLAGSDDIEVVAGE